MEELALPASTTPTTIPPGVVVESATPPIATPPSAQSILAQPQASSFMGSVDWVETSLVIGAFVGIIFIVWYCSNSIKKENSTMDSFTSELSGLQDTVTSLQQSQVQAEKNAMGNNNNNPSLF